MCKRNNTPYFLDGMGVAGGLYDDDGWPFVLLTKSISQIGLHEKEKETVLTQTDKHKRFLLSSD